MARFGRSRGVQPHTNYQNYSGAVGDGGIGIYFSRLLLSGTVTLLGSGVANAIVRLIRQSTDTEIAKATTDANGFYQFVGALVVIASENYHITVEYTDGGSIKYNAKSLWNVVPIVV